MSKRIVLLAVLVQVLLTKVTRLQAPQLGVPYFFDVEVSKKANTLEIVAPKYPFYTLATISFIPTSCVQYKEYAFQDVKQTERTGVTTFRADVLREACVGVHRPSMTIEKVVVCVKKGIPVADVGFDGDIFILLAAVVPLAYIFTKLFLKNCEQNPILLDQSIKQQ